MKIKCVDYNNYLIKGNYYEAEIDLKIKSLL